VPVYDALLSRLQPALGLVQSLAVPVGRFDLIRFPTVGALGGTAGLASASEQRLLTREAFAVYARQLAPDGLLLVNVSNRYLSLDRVACGSGRSVGFDCVLTETPSDPARHLARAEWALLGREPSVAAELTRGLPLRTPGPDVLWTDTRASILSILR